MDGVAGRALGLGVFGLDELYADGEPDLVISGMNVGSNAGIGISHSGTVHGATTATEMGIPAMAVSLENPPGWSDGMTVAAPSAAAYVVELVARLQEDKVEGGLMPAGVSLNVNIPVKRASDGGLRPPRGERMTVLDLDPPLSADYQNTTGAAGEPGIYRIGFQASDLRPDKGSDRQAVARNYVSFTPLEVDRDVDRRTVRRLRSFVR